VKAYHNEQLPTDFEAKIVTPLQILRRVGKRKAVLVKGVKVH
jgi:hypothetical protein